MALGSAWPLEEELHAEVRGRDLVTGLPKTIVISTEEIREAIEEPVVGDRRRGEGHARQDAARAGGRHHGAGHRAHRWRRAAHRPRRPPRARDRHADRDRPQPALLRWRIGSGQSLEEFEALKGVLFSSNTRLIGAQPLALSTSASAVARFTLILLILTSITLLTLDFRGFGPVDSRAERGARRRSRPVGDVASDALPPRRQPVERRLRLRRPQEARTRAAGSRSTSSKARSRAATSPSRACSSCSSRSTLPSSATSRPQARVSCRVPSPTSTTPSRSTRARRRHQAGMPVVAGTGLVGSSCVSDTDRSSSSSPTRRSRSACRWWGAA